MQSFNVVVVGGGYFSQFHIDAWLQLDNAKLVGIIEPDEDRGSRLRSRFTNLDVFASLNAFKNSPVAATYPVSIIDIVTPPATHLNLCKTALELISANGVVVCQKPFCTNFADARFLSELSRTSDRRLVVHENFRFQPWYGKLKEVLASGELGQILQADFRLRPGDGQGSDAYLARQPYFQQMPKFLIRETGIHWVDTFRFLFGEPVTVYADLKRLNPAINGEDSGYFLMEFHNGIRALFDGNRLLDHNAENHRLTMGEMRVEGTQGSLRLDGYGAIYLRKFTDTHERKLDYSFDQQSFGGGAVKRLNAHILAHLESDAPLANSASDYLRNLELEQLIYESAEKKARLNC